MRTRLYFQPGQAHNPWQTVTKGDRPCTAPRWTPALEWHQTETAIILRVEVPGVSAEDLEVQVTQDTIAIAGTRRPPEGKVQSELQYGQFHRLVSLPVAVLNTQVQAKLEQGILTLTLPKREAVHPRVVKVSLGHQDSKAASLQPEPAHSEPTPEETQNSTALEGDIWAA